MAGMCFSATASFSAASITAVIGIATLRQVKEPHELLLAAMPLLFALQQAIEGALWLQLPGGNGGAAAALSLSFVVFAKVLWPAYTPLAVLLIEPDLRRRQALSAIAVAGCALSIYVFNRLSIIRPLPQSTGTASTTGAMKTHCPIRVSSISCAPASRSCFLQAGAIQNFGAIVLAGFAVSAYTYFATFISVWCFFAAAGSSLLYFYFKRAAVRARAT